MSWFQRFFGWAGGNPVPRANALHRAIVRKARAVELFGEKLIQDDLEGRFQAIAVYAALVFPRLENSGREGKAVSKALNKAVFRSFDDALRETGVGDASIARKVRKMGEEFFGIGLAVNTALRSEDPGPALEAVILRNRIAPREGCGRLAQIVLSDHAALEAVANTDIVDGQLPW